MQIHKGPLLSVVVMGCLVLACIQSMVHEAQANQIRQTMRSMFDKPDEPLNVDLVVVEGEYAVAGWTQSGRGGRAILQKTHDRWTIVLCGGDGLKDAAVLAQTGMPTARASALASGLATAEGKIDMETRKQFSMFDGIVYQGHR